VSVGSVPASHPDCRCHKIVTAHASVAKDSGKALGTLPGAGVGRSGIRRRSASTLPLAVLLTEPGERRVARRRYRARDRRHEETPRPRTHGHHAYATTGCGTKRRSSSSKTAYLLADMIGDLLHGRGPKPAGPRPTTITREERFAADVRLRGSRTAWRDKRRTPRPRPVAGPGRRSG